jgi:hypothetical protein
MTRNPALTAAARNSRTDPAGSRDATPADPPPRWELARTLGTARTRGAVRRWLRRYAPAEIVGTVAAASFGMVTVPIASPAVVGVVASWAETVGFYGTMAARELRHRLRRARGRDAGTLRAAAATTSALVAEFGVAEAVDTLLVRPALIAVSLQLSPTPLVGIVVGKLLADLAFYVPAIASWELLRRRASDGRSPAGRRVPTASRPAGGVAAPAEES